MVINPDSDEEDSEDKSDSDAEDSKDVEDVANQNCIRQGGGVRHMHEK